MSEPVDTSAVVHDAAKRAEYMAERGWCDDDIALLLLRALQSALITAAQREIADLRNRLNLSEKLHGRFPVDAVQPDQKAAAFADRDELQRDAARYRYLRNQEGLPTPEEFDRMVDADMAMVAEGRTLGEGV